MIYWRIFDIGTRIHWSNISQEPYILKARVQTYYHNIINLNFRKQIGGEHKNYYITFSHNYVQWERWGSRKRLPLTRLPLEKFMTTAADLEEKLDIPLKAVWAVTNSQKIGWDGGGQKLQKIFVMASGCKDDLDHHCQTFSNAILFWSHKKTCFAVRMRGAL